MSNYDYMEDVLRFWYDEAELRGLGRIDENTWAFFMTEVFVPENEKARNLGMAGNTLSYDEYVRDYGASTTHPFRRARISAGNAAT